MFRWATFRKKKGAVKAHTLIDLDGNIPAWIFITEGLVHDVNALDHLPIEARAYYVMDKGYVDFKRMYRMAAESATWITRAKDNMKYKRLYSAPTDRSTGDICDQIIVLLGFYLRKDYPDKMCRIKYKDPETNITYKLITCNFKIEATTICKLYKQRWQVELFFKWIKQNLRTRYFMPPAKMRHQLNK